MMAHCIAHRKQQHKQQQSGGVSIGISSHGIVGLQPTRRFGCCCRINLLQPVLWMQISIDVPGCRTHLQDYASYFHQFEVIGWQSVPNWDPYKDSLLSSIGHWSSTSLKSQPFWCRAFAGFKKAAIASETAVERSYQNHRFFMRSIVNHKDKYGKWPCHLRIFHSNMVYDQDCLWKIWRWPCHVHVWTSIYLTKVAGVILPWPSKTWLPRLENTQQPSSVRAWGGHAM